MKPSHHFPASEPVLPVVEAQHQELSGSVVTVDGEIRSESLQQLDRTSTFPWQTGDLRTDQKESYRNVWMMCSFHDCLEDGPMQSPDKGDCEDHRALQTTYHTSTLSDFVHRVMVEGQTFSPVTYRQDDWAGIKFQSGDTLWLSFSNKQLPFFKISDAENDEFIRRYAFIVFCRSDTDSGAELNAPLAVGFHLTDFVSSQAAYDTLLAQLD